MLRAALACMAVVGLAVPAARAQTETDSPTASQSPTASPIVAQPAVTGYTFVVGAATCDYTVTDQRAATSTLIWAVSVVRDRDVLDVRGVP